MKYKIGDKVRVRDDLRLGEVYKMDNGTDYDSVVFEMLKLKGKEVTISTYTDSNKYLVSEDRDCWNWTDEMFSGLATRPERVTEKEPNFKIGQFVRVINNDTNNFPIGQIVQIIKFNKNKVLCEGYCCDRRWIDTQTMFDYQIEELPEEAEHDSVAGWLTADEVSKRIKEHYENGMDRCQG